MFQNGSNLVESFLNIIRSYAETPGIFDFKKDQLSLILLILLRDEGRILRIVIGADIPTNIEICEELVESSDAIKFQSSLALKLSSYVMLGLLFDEIFKKIAFLFGLQSQTLTSIEFRL